MNVSMSRSHAWVKRGEEFIDRIPMNWGKNLTLLGAIRLTGWVVLTTQFATANKCTSSSSLDHHTARARRRRRPGRHRWGLSWELIGTT